MKHINLKNFDIASFRTKQEAIQFAKECGWPRNRVVQAANRFSIFWVVGQGIDDKTYRLLQRSKKTVDIEFKGFF